MASLSQDITSQLSTARKAQDAIVKSNNRLDKAKAYAQSQDIPPIAVSPAHGQLLSLYCKLLSAKSVLEIGTLAGYSTIWLAESVPGVKVTTIEYAEKHRDVAEHNFQGMDNIDLQFGSALDILPKLYDEGAKFDFVLIDADWDNQHVFFERAVKMTRKGGLVYIDNAVWKITRFERRGQAGSMKLIDWVGKDDRVEATLIPMVSTDVNEALVDGYILAQVK